MKCLLRRALDTNEFLSPYGVRSMSKAHETPYVFEIGGQRHEVTYQPAESDTLLFGGNSNWRGPVWFPVNYLLIEALKRFHDYYGDDFKLECPTFSGEFHTIRQVGDQLADRLAGLFLRDAEGRRAAHGDRPKLQDDPAFRDHILFHEYFHAETGRGLGASHQTGWTALVANLLMPVPDRMGMPRDS